MDNAGLSIEKLESHLQILKETFAEKEDMLKTLKDSCGPNANYSQDYPALNGNDTKSEVMTHDGLMTVTVSQY